MSTTLRRALVALVALALAACAIAAAAAVAGAALAVRAAVRLSRAARAPVRIVLDRREEQIDSGNRPATVQKMKIGAKRDGTLSAIAIEAWGSAGVALGAGVGNIAQSMYSCGNFSIAQSDVFMNAGPGCAMRAPGNVPGAFALEQLIEGGPRVGEQRAGLLGDLVVGRGRVEQQFGEPYPLAAQRAPDFNCALIGAVHQAAEASADEKGGLTHSVALVVERFPPPQADKARRTERGANIAVAHAVEGREETGGFGRSVFHRT